MKTAKKLTSLVFVLGLLTILSSVYLMLTNQASLTLYLVLGGLVLITAAFTAALVILTREQQKVVVTPGPKDAPGSVISTLLDILLAIFIRL